MNIEQNDIQLFSVHGLEQFLANEVNRNIASESMEASTKIAIWDTKDNPQPLSAKTVKLLSNFRQIQCTTHYYEPNKFARVIGIGTPTTKEFLKRDLINLLYFFDKHVNSGTFDYGILRSIRALYYSSNNNTMAFKDHKIYLFMYPCLSGEMTNLWDAFGNTQESLKTILN